ncbi:MAG: hypothetical protein KA198_03985, partial [Chitinophagaceae bacterium]|nr:hypothetical protein [Chitinophagaceae bacterium]
MLKIKHYTFILILCSIFFGSNSFAQSVTWNTVTQGTGLLGNNGAGGITFVIENTNGFPAVLNTVSNYYSSNNTSNVELWYSTTSLSGATNAITPANGWTQIATGSVPVNNNTPFNATVGTLNTLFTNLNFTINPGTTYRFYILSSVSLEYTGLTNPTGAAPLSYNFNGVNLHTGEYLINNAFVGFGGSGTNGPPNNPRAFCGEVNLTLLSTPCNGQPVAGTTTASTLTPCPGSLVSFALTGSTSAGGLSYQWIRANTSSGPWVALPGASNATYQTLTTGNRCFRCIVTCLSNGLFDTSSVICVNTIPWSPVGNCWCIPQYATGGVNNLITNFSLDNLNNNTSLSSNVTPFWVDYTGAQTGSNPTLSIPNLYIGLPATANVTFGSSTTNFSAIWIDFNHNGAFDTTEYYSSTLNPGANGTQAITINVPGAAQSGITRMRIRGGHNAQMLKTHACGFTNSTLGEAEDYLVNVVPSSLKDPAITSINVPSGSCLTTNESVTVNLANYGSTNINLLLDSVKVTLKVNGPLGLVNYNKTVSSGSLFSYGGNSIPITFTGVNLYDGGTYFINTSLAFAPPGGGASNVVLINDSLFSPIIKVNVRPVAGPDFHVCQNSPILFGQGLSVSGCANPVYDSIELVFTVTPCQDNTGATTNGTSQTVPGAGCANTFACDFASVNIPSLPTGAYFTQNGLLTVSNLSSGFRNEVRFNLYGASPNPPTLFAPCQQGFAVGTVFTTGQSVGTNAFFFNRRLITLPQLSAIFNPANVNTPLHLGYFESWNDLVNASDLTPNSNGPTEVKLKVWYAYIPAKIKWYDNNTSTTLLDTLVPFNPLSPNVLSPTTQLSNTSNPG